jgi:hypothetical protein
MYSMSKHLNGIAKLQVLYKGPYWHPPGRPPVKNEQYCLPSLYFIFINEKRLISVKDSFVNKSKKFLFCTKFPFSNILFLFIYLLARSHMLNMMLGPT